MKYNTNKKLSTILINSLPKKRNMYAMLLHIIINNWRFLHTNNQHVQISQLSLDGKDLVLYVYTSPNKILKTQRYIHKLNPLINNLIFPYKIHKIFLFSKMLSNK